MMQWSTAYGIPAAIAVSGGWSLFVKHVQTFRALHYWWVPDSTFIDMLPEQLIFARHSANEWLAGDKKTGGLGSYVSKMVSNNLRSKAGRVREFLCSEFLLGNVFDVSHFLQVMLELEAILTARRSSWEFLLRSQTWSPTCFGLACEPTGFAFVLLNYRQFLLSHLLRKFHEYEYYGSQTV